MNYFELFGVPVSFLPDEKILRGKYLSLSRRYHPDHFTQVTAEEQANALQQATLVNKAYAVLMDFEKRMQYILELKEIIVSEGKYTLSPEFLMEMMELSEQAMESVAAGNAGDTEAAKQRIALSEAELMRGIMPVLSAYNEQTATDEIYAMIAEFYYKRRYLIRIRSQMEPDQK